MADLYTSNSKMLKLHVSKFIKILNAILTIFICKKLIEICTKMFYNYGKITKTVKKVPNRNDIYVH